MKLKKNPQVNVGRNSSLYFAVGLIVMLLITYIGLEHKSYESEASTFDTLLLDDQIDEDIPITTIEIPLPPPPPAQKVIVTEAITIVEDVANVEESVIESTEIGQDDIIDEREVGVEEVEVVEVEEDIEVPFSVIEKVPVFPGCSGNNTELKACFEKKMQEHLQKNFRYPEAAQELNIHGRVFVLFVIDKYGKVTQVKSRGPNHLLEAEAERIIGLLPKMKPGRQRDRNVSVPYSIPINFKLEMQ